MEVNQNTAGRKKTEEFSSGEPAEIQSLFSALPDALLIYDTHMNVRKVNPAFIKKYGLNPVGFNVKEIITAFSCRWLDGRSYLLDDQPTPKALQGTVSTSNIFLISHLGVESVIETTSLPLYENGIITGCITIWHDITNLNNYSADFRISENRYRQIIEFAPFPIFVNRNNKIEYANDAALEMLGASHNIDINGKSVFEIFHPDYHEVVKNRIKDLHQGKTLSPIEEKIIRLNGEVIDVEVNANLVHDNEGDTIHFFLKDISQQKKNREFQQALDEIEKIIYSSLNPNEIIEKTMWRAALTTSCDSAAVSFYNSNDNTWQVKHAFGFDNNIIGMVIPGNDEPHALLALQLKKSVIVEDTHIDPRVNSERLEKWGIRSVLVVPLFTQRENIGAIFFNYYKLKKISTEKIKFVKSLANSISMALENSVLYESVMKELEERKQREAELAKLNKALTALSKSSQVMLYARDELSYARQVCQIVVEDFGQSIVSIHYAENDEAKTIRPIAWAGFDDGYITGINLTWEDVPHGQGPTGRAIRSGQPVVCKNIPTDPSFLPWRDEAMKRGYSSAISLPLVTKDAVIGSLNIYSTETDAFPDDVVNLLCELAKDLANGITMIRLREANQKAMESLKTLNATKDKFFSIIAHDLKNPFTSLLGASELLFTNAGKFDNETTKNLGKILHDSAKKGYALLENLLEWSRSQSGNISFAPQFLNFRKVIAENLSYVDINASNKNIKFQLQVPAEIEIFADKNMLNTILRNLLHNAIKFSYENSRVCIYVSESETEVTVSVKDHGIGISEENIKRLFRIDQKYTNLGTNKELGTGLGLILCKEFIEKHRGRIWVESKVGKGSKFSFAIPVVLRTQTS